MTQLHSTAKDSLTPTERACARGLTQHPMVLQNTRGRVLESEDEKAKQIVGDIEEMKEKIEDGGEEGQAKR